jgi:hypothetical protein
LLNIFWPTAGGLLYETCFFIVFDNVCDAKKVSELMINSIEKNMAAMAAMTAIAMMAATATLTLTKRRQQSHQQQ